MLANAKSTYNPFRYLDSIDGTRSGQTQAATQSFSCYSQQVGILELDTLISTLIDRISIVSSQFLRNPESNRVTRALLDPNYKGVIDGLSREVFSTRTISISINSMEHHKVYESEIFSFLFSGEDRELIMKLFFVDHLADDV